MKRKLLLTAVLLACLLTNMTGAVAEPAALTGLPPDKTGAKAAPAALAGLQRVAESDHLALYYDSGNISITVEDKRNGYIWSSAVGDSYYDASKLNPTWKANLKALFHYSYTNGKDISETNSNMNNPTVKAVPVKNGISLAFDLKTVGIGLTIVILLEKDALHVKVPLEEIRESGKNSLVSVQLMPYLGASVDTENGYFFYPDGSGALMRFKGKPYKDEKKYTWYVYGSDKVDAGYSESMEQSGDKQAMLPVFGVKREDNAFIAVIDKGEYDSCINLVPSGNTVNLNRISSEFTYRRIFTDVTARMKMVSRVEKEMIRSEHSVKYVFLAGEDANYSGMANVYRDHLIGEGGIKKNTRPDDQLPLALDLFMGIMEDRLLIDRFVPMTTFAQAEQIMREYLAKGVKDLQVNLIGWTPKGFGSYPQHLPPEPALGGEDGMKKLSRFASEQNIRMYLQDNFIDIVGKNGGFSGRHDVVYHRNQLIVTDRRNSRFLFNPVNALKKYMESYLPDIRHYDIKGIVFEKLGEYVYFDYNRYQPVSRSETAAHWEKFLSEAEKQLGNAAARGGNAYVLKYANWLADVPVDDSGYFITDESVPFYQMVVHGLIPYSSQPGNLFYDFPKQKLTWVEYGCIPYFKLTYEKSGLLKYTAYNSLFTSHYKDWLDLSAAIYEEFSQRLGYLRDKKMTEHVKLEQNVYRVTYEDGSKIYVNYGEQSADVQGYTVKAMDYLVVDPGGRIR